MSRNQTYLSVESVIEDLGKKARESGYVLATTSPEVINSVLADIADSLRENVNNIIIANREDLSTARAKNLSAAMIDRLTLNEERIKVMADSAESIINLPSPVGKILSEWERPNGLRIQKKCVPLGVLGMIYESRPNVTLDAAALCLKSHNSVILRGGSECLKSSLAIYELITDALKKNGLPTGCVGMVPVADRSAVTAMLQAETYIDVMIPRGGKGLIEKIMKEAQMPVLAHLEGICHTYVHKSADPEIAVNVTLNSKMRRTGICGATETLLLDESLDPEISRKVLATLIEAGCEIVGTPEIQKLDRRVGAAGAIDWSTEYLDAKLSAKAVRDVQEAAAHINKYGSHHTDSILAEDREAVEYFLENVDSGIVLHNASTQFADGGEFGMGAEIGISTGKLHARGPVGVEQLTTYKYVVRGSGQTRP
jgi:glutamate-5-semialdehyde dehydrogenase